MKEQSKKLVSYCEKVFEKNRDSRHDIIFLGDDNKNIEDGEEANKLLNNLKEFPHAFVMACLMDRRIKAERAWIIPYKLKKSIGSFDIDILAGISQDRYSNTFSKKNIHFMNKEMAKVFFEGIQRIKNQYSGDASNIWKDKPSSATVVYRFLEFYGCGPKIATMAANILATRFKIEMSDHTSIDVSPDVHVKRVMRRMGLVDKKDINLIIYKARELNPEFPGIIDPVLWRVGREFCHAKKLECKDCNIKDFCGKVYCV
ncbi:MAG TPA: iron-sulfur cluster loop [bacterium]|nr:iron-sulfur cluster loop [bacterium]